MFQIQGFNGSSIKYDVQEGNHKQLAISFPGTGYTHNHPYMFYLNHLLAEKQFDVVRVHYHYKQSKSFMEADFDKQDEWLTYDACQVFDAVVGNSDYERIVLLGKSIGTKALGGLIEKKELSKAEMIWLTPLLQNQKLFERMRNGSNRSLVIGGTADESFSIKEASLLKDLNQYDVEIVDGGTHGLFIEGNVLESIEVLQKIVNSVSHFIEKR